MSDNEIRMMLIVVALVASLASGFGTYHVCQTVWRADSIKMGYAERDSIHGHWKWKQTSTPSVRIMSDEQDENPKVAIQ